MGDPFVAEIRVFACNFAPKGWAFCDGQLMPISQNTALFSLLGTYYGGDGRVTFALPNLQGSVPIQAGQGPGLSDRFLGEASGTPYVTLLESEIQAHTHTEQALALFGASNDPIGRLPSKPFGGGLLFDPGAANLVTMNPNSIGVTGGSQPHNNTMPTLTLNYCIALQGVFPPRS
jgi:microcystin-dependent protein